MHAAALSAASILLLALVPVNADTSLYIPFFNTDAGPVSADVLGVGSDGRTTWRLHNGAPTGTFTSESTDATATLVEGPSDAVLSFTAASGALSVSFGASCTSIGNGNAACVETIVEDSSTVAQTITEAVSQIAVQGGSTIPATATAQPTQTQSTGSGKNSAPSDHGSMGVVGFSLVVGFILSYTL